MKQLCIGLAFAFGAASCLAAQVYPVPEGERLYSGYTVKVDGAEAPVSEVRCSAMPFNRRWPGHQRQIEQTELCGMVRFAFEEKTTLAVTADKDFKTVKIRPLSRNVAFHRKGRTVTFDLIQPGGYSVEFDGYHNNLHVFADATKEYAPPPNAIVFGPGFHDVGIRELKSGDTVYLDPGAVVYGGFHASNATDIAILGRGILDGGKLKEKILFAASGDGHEAVQNAKRWHTIDFKNCRNVKIDGLTIRDSLLYNIAMWGCEDVAVSGVKIIGQWRFNTDGIDLHNCRRMRVTDCFARTFDDTFCFKAHEGYGNCEDGVFERCVAWNDWGKAFEVGVECRADHLRRLAFRDCDCIHAVSWAIDVSNVDYGRVSDVTFENIRIEKDEPMPSSQLQTTDDMPFDAKKGLDAPPRLFQGSVHFHHEYSKENGGKWSGGGVVDGVMVRNVSVTTDGRKPLIKMGAIDVKHRPENIVFEDLTVDGKPVGGASAINLELGEDAIEPSFRVSDAKRMGAEEMNPGSALGCRERAAGGAFKVLIYGNSIALHGRAPNIGWDRDWGMAASAREKDFAHLVIAGLEARRGGRADFRIRNLAVLERNFRTNLTDFADLASDVAYAPDYVVIAIGENVSSLGKADEADYTQFLVSLAKPLVTSAKRPPVVLRSPFWRNAVKADCTAKAAKEVGAIYVDAGPLGDQEENMALGLFEHKGVARHPGDLGMRRLADLILAGFGGKGTQPSATPSTPRLDAETVRRHAVVARRAAADGMVLLKNDGTLPLAKGSAIALFGGFATYRPGGGGSSNVKPIRTVTIPQGLAEVGFRIDPESREAAVFVIERKSAESSDCPDDEFDLSAAERETLAQIKAAGFQKIVVVCNSGHALNFRPIENDPAIGAILFAWYPGGEGGAAVGDVLVGSVNPSGRLVATFAEHVADYSSNPGFRDSRWFVPYEEDVFVGYRYFETIPGAKGNVVYPFGHGLSYTTFAVKTVAAETGGDTVRVRVRVTNTGRAPGRRSVLCYTSQKGGKAEHPAIELRAFAKTAILAPGAFEELMLAFPKRDLAYFDDEGSSAKIGSWVIDSGHYRVLVGGSVRDITEAAAFEVEREIVLATPGFKLQSDRLAKRLRADGSFTSLPVSYPGHVEPADRAPVSMKAADKVACTLFDVADGKATIDDVLNQMSLQEMLHLLFGHPRHDPSGTGSIGDFEKFGISAAQTCDGPAGVRRATPSTYFPCAALLACTFDAALLHEIGDVIGAEAAEVDFDILLAPGLCIHRHPLCGRNFEYFSEDPLVAGVCAAAYVRGVQRNGVGATVKHFAGNGRETTRKTEKDIVSERAFREIYLRGFERAVKEAEPWAIMTSYNGMNGYNSSENYGLITGILRDEWGYKGLTMTDWSTTVPMWREIGAGNDVKMPNEFEDTTKLFAKDGDGIKEAVRAYQRNYLSVAKVRESAKRVCEFVMKTRRFARERQSRRIR